MLGWASNRWLIGLTIALVATIGSLSLPAVREAVRSVVGKRWIAHLNGYRYGYRVDYAVRIPMADGVKLAASLYLPTRGERLGTIYVRLPYDRLTYGEGLWAAEYFARHGFAVLVQDIRGKHGSEGRFVPYESATSDGAATLDWIVAQPWSNGKVGTFGCSALGELQYALARARHPAHAAMVPLGAGGAMGSAMGRYSYFGLYEGGIFQLASGFGWFAENGAPDPRAAPPAKFDRAATLARLPVADLMQAVNPGANAYEYFVRTPLHAASWKDLDYVDDGDRFVTPSLVINTWGDQTVGDTLALAEFARARSGGSLVQHVVIAPGTHCHSQEAAEEGVFGDLPIPDAERPYMDWNLRWFDHWLNGRGDGLRGMPPYLFYMMGEGRWLEASQWPPAQSQVERWYLSSEGRANGAAGDGVLSRTPAAMRRTDRFRYDPMNPVPSRGGPVCCTGLPDERAGPVDQRDVEARDDVLVYTSAPLDRPLRIAGPLRARLVVDSSARDTDFVARLVDVFPDGRAIGIQEGALRARYRQGIDRLALLEPGRPVELSIDMRAIGHTLTAGHRLRLDITSSSFPRLERNLNTGGNNFDESLGVVAINGVHHGGDAHSYLELHALPADDGMREGANVAK
jgi:putative CocE/NonD family hydrolase